MSSKSKETIEGNTLLQKGDLFIYKLYELGAVNSNSGILANTLQEDMGVNEQDFISIHTQLLHAGLIQGLSFLWLTDLGKENAIKLAEEQQRRSLTIEPTISALFTEIEETIEKSSIEKELKEVALYDLEQAQKAYSAEAFKACIVMLGAVLEGLMLGVLRSPKIIEELKAHPSPPKALNRIGGAKHPELHTLIAKDLGFEEYKTIIHYLEPTIEKLQVESIQSFRNAIHPWISVQQPNLYTNYALIQTRATHYLTSLRMLASHIINLAEKETLAKKEIFIEPSTGDVQIDGQSIPPLTFQEYQLLSHFQAHEGEIISRQEICSLLWPDKHAGECVYRLDKLISRLRQKIEPNPGKPHYIQTVRGRGHRFRSS